jgi:hypothetical protein
MSTRLYPRHVPVPARGLAASHRELRQALAALRVVSHGSTCPPAGHALWSMLTSAVHGLDGALTRHLDHERNLNGKSVVSPTIQAEIEEQHTRLVVQSAGLSQLVVAARIGDERAWHVIRQAAERVIATLADHLDWEDRLLLRPETSVLRRLG